MPDSSLTPTGREKQSIYDSPAMLRPQFNKVIERIHLSDDESIPLAEREFSYSRDKALIELTYLTAGRVSEILSLKKQNWNWPESGNFCYVRDMVNRKNKVIRYKTIPIPKEDSYAIHVKSLIDKYIPKSEYYIFYSRKKTFGYSTPNGLKAMNRSTAWRIISKAGENADIKLWPHLLRHYRLSHLAPNLTDRELIQISGHRNSSNLEHYIRVNVDVLKEKIPKG